MIRLLIISGIIFFRLFVADQAMAEPYKKDNTSLDSSKKAVVTVMVDGIAGYDILQFNAASGLATFSGLSYGAAIEPHISLGFIGIGTHVRVQVSNLENKANNATQNETISSLDTQMSLRVRSGAIFLGMGPALRFLKLSGQRSNGSFSTNYNCYGLRLEFGTRVHIGDFFNFSPTVQYENLIAVPNTGTGTRRINAYSFTMGVGISF